MELVAEPDAGAADHMSLALILANHAEVCVSPPHHGLRFIPKLPRHRVGGRRALVQ
jgi:hypothetical protein